MFFQFWKSKEIPPAKPNLLTKDLVSFVEGMTLYSIIIVNYSGNKNYKEYQLREYKNVVIENNRLKQKNEVFYIGDDASNFFANKNVACGGILTYYDAEIAKLEKSLNETKSLKKKFFNKMQADKRPANFASLNAEAQWAIDKELGILDWDGK